MGLSLIHIFKRRGKQSIFWLFPFFIEVSKMIFDRFFKKTKNISNVQPVEFLSGTSSFSPWDGDSYSNDIFRAAVDAIARNAGKLKGTHFIQNGDMKQPAEDKLNRLLQVQPNQ